MFYVFYKKEDGQIVQTLNTSKELTVEQMAEQAAKGINTLQFPEGQHTHGKRVNPATRIIEDCPVFAENMRVGAIDAQLRELDEKKQRALFDGLRKGDWTWFDKHEAAAEKLRKERESK